MVRFRGMRHEDFGCSALPTESAARNFPVKFLGNAGRMGIFAFEDFSHESGRKPLFLAQIRSLERCA